MVPSIENIKNGSFFGVYDGHSTVLVAELLKEKLHEYVIDSYEKQGSIVKAYFEGKDVLKYFLPSQPF